jgi:hypothetical protein
MKKVILFLAGIHCYTACNNETVIPADPQESPRQPLELFIPGTETVSVYSTATESECTIDTLWVLVFDGDTQTKRWAEKIGRSQIMNNGQATQLLPQLKHTINNGDRVICIANVRENPDTTNVTPDNINTCFKTRHFYYYFDGDQLLPMYGEIPSWSAAGAYTCRMIRAMAKVQVQLGPTFSDVTGDFNADNVSYWIYNHPLDGFIQPKSTLAGIPGTAGDIFEAGLKFLQKDGATAVQTSAFIYEYQSSIHTITDTVTNVGIKTFHSERPLIYLIKNLYDPVKERHYRLDFYNAADSEFLDIKRNHHYLFTINKVGSDGYGEERESSLAGTEAYYNPGSNIEYTIRVDDNSQSVTSNGQYAVVTSVDTVRIPGNVTNQTVATFRYIDPKGTLKLRPEVGLNSISVESVQPNTATLFVTPSGTNQITNTNQPLQITTTGNLEQAVILFKLGNIMHRLPVKKI